MVEAILLWAIKVIVHHNKIHLLSAKCFPPSLNDFIGSIQLDLIGM
jgi:hypothetical protein